WSLSAGGRLILDWIESDGPSCPPPTRKGFGTSVIDRMIGEGEIHRIGANKVLRAKLSFNCDGVSCARASERRPRHSLLHNVVERGRILRLRWRVGERISPIFLGEIG